MLTEGLYLCSLAPNEPEKWGCRMRIRDLFSKISRLIQYYETTRPKKQRVHLHPLHPLVWRLCICPYITAIHFSKKFQISVGPCLPQNNLYPYITCPISKISLVPDRMRFSTMSRYNFLMPIQGAKALKNPLNFLNTVIPQLARFWCQEKNHAW